MIPSDLKSSLFYSQTPWEISQGFGLEPKSIRFKVIKLDSSDPKAQFVFCYFEANKPEGYCIGCVTYILNSDSHAIFSSHIIQIKELPKDTEAYYANQLLQAKRENHVEEQILYFEKLSDLYLQKRDWVQAAKLLNCALAILEKNLDDPSYQTYLFLRLERIEALFLESKGIMIPSQHKGTILNYRSWLKNIRSLYMEQHERKDPIQEIAVFLTHSYCKFLGCLILDSQMMLGTPPTQWACIGMGSMAREEMCIYSDLEFAFLIDTKTEKNLEYFRTLSQLLELRIINLGETKFPVFAKLFGEQSIQASPTPGGLSMDIGGNTPIGKPGFYELIDTPLGLAHYLCEKWMEADIIVTNALSTICHIAGYEKLTLNYHTAKEEKLNAKEAFFSLIGIPFRQRLALRLLKENLREYKPNLSKEKQETNAFGIKKELYRPLQSILSSLALFHGIKLSSTFELIQQLHKKGILSSEGVENLTRTLKQILALRFEAHTFYQREEEFLLHVEQETARDPHFLYLDGERLKILHGIYMVLIPLQRCGEDFVETKNIQNYSKATFYDESPSVQGLAFEKTLQYAAAQEAFQNAVSLNPNDVDAQLLLASIEMTMGQNKEALSRNLKALTIAQQKHGENHPDIARSYNNIGANYSTLGDYKNALDFCQKASKIWVQMLGDNHPDVAISYNNIGGVYSDLGDYDKAMEFYLMALKIWLQTLEADDPYIAQTYNNIGTACIDLGDNQEALEYFEKGLAIKLKVFGENHPEVARSYNNIGGVFLNLGDYTGTIFFCQKALKIWIKVFGNNHIDVANSYQTMGCAYTKLQESDEAFEFFQKTLEIKQQLLGNDHPDLAISYNNIASVHQNCGNYNKALEFFQKSLGIMLQGQGNPSSIANSYNNIGGAYYYLGDYNKAFEFYQKALEIQLQVFGKKHPDVATSYNNIGKIYDTNGDYDKALTYFQKVLEIRLKAFGDNHPDVAQIYNSIGTAFDALGNGDEALVFYQMALKIQLEVLGEYHPDVAISYSNIGAVHNGRRNYRLALSFSQKALKIWIQTLGENHPDVAQSYLNSSALYFNLRDYSEALFCCQKALNIRLQVLGENHPDVAANYKKIARIYTALGNFTKADEFNKKT